MASFYGHMALAAPLGAATAAVGWHHLGLDPACAVLGGCLCTFSGMLPDLDSDSGKPVREMFSLLGALVPVMLLRRLSESGLSEDAVLLALIGVYFLVRFGLATVFKTFTVHRGMFHSVPAMLVCGLLVFNTGSETHLEERAFHACAAMLGFFSHLFLDEIYSVKLTFWGGVRFNQFAGTAVKFFGPSWRANVACYLLLGLTAYHAVLEVEQATGRQIQDWILRPSSPHAAPLRPTLAPPPRPQTDAPPVIRLLPPSSRDEPLARPASRLVK